MSYEEKYDFMTNIKTRFLVNIQSLVLSRIQNKYMPIFFLLFADIKSWQIIPDLFKNIFYGKI